MLGGFSTFGRLWYYNYITTQSLWPHPILTVQEVSSVLLGYPLCGHGGCLLLGWAAVACPPTTSNLKHENISQRTLVNFGWVYPVSRSPSLPGLVSTTTSTSLSCLGRDLRSVHTLSQCDLSHSRVCTALSLLPGSLYITLSWLLPVRAARCLNASYHIHASPL